MRRVLIVIGIIVAITIAGAVVFVATFDVNRYHGAIQSQLEQRLGRKVTLGDMHLNLFPPRFSVQNLTIADDSNFGTEKPFVQTQQLDVSVKLFPLIKGMAEINSVSLQRPSVELIKNQQGVWNFSSLGGPSESTGGGAPQFSLARLAISDGQVAVTDLQSKSVRSVYDHIDLNLLDFAPNAPFSITLAANLPGPGTQQIRLDGQAGPIVQGQLASTPFHGTLEMRQVAIAGLQKFLASPALVNTDGVLTGKTKIGSESGKITASGQMDLQKAKVRGLDLGYPISAQYDITDDLSGDMITIRDTTIKLGTMPISVGGTVDTKRSPAQIDFRVKSDNVSIAEAAKLAAALGVAFSPGATIAGNVNVDVRAQGPADKPALSGTISGRDVQVSGKSIPQPVNIRTVNLSFTPTEIRSENFNVISGGTTIAAQFILRQYQSKSPQVDATLRAPNAALAGVLSMAKAYGVTGLENISGAGTLSIDLHATGTSDKPTMSGTVAGRDVQISGKSIPQPVSIKAVNLGFTSTEIHSDNFNVTSGGTTVAAQFVLREYLSKSPLADATLRATNASLPDLLATAKAYGVTGLDKITGAGTLKMDMHAAGPLQTLTSAEVMKALNGTLNLNFNSMRYAGSDIAHQLASIGGFLKPGEKDQGFTNISHMTGDIAVKNGFAQTNNLLATLDIGNVAVTGTTNLLNEALDLRVTAVLSKEFSQRAGGTGVGGYMNTALANNQGELVIPAIVTGTFENPKFMPDLQKVAQMKLKGMVPSLNSSGGVAGILGGVLGQKGATQAQPQQEQPQQQQQPPNSVQQLFDIFGNKKKQEQQTPSK
jgi:AsmA protein